MATRKVDRMGEGYPKVIRELPEADVAFEGVRAWIAQGVDHQFVFFDMLPSAVVPEHAHNYTQWGVVLDGEMELTIGGTAKVYRRGDDYTIPAGVKHSARFHKPARVLDFFGEKTRYRAKKR